MEVFGKLKASSSCVRPSGNVTKMSSCHRRMLPLSAPSVGVAIFAIFAIFTIFTILGNAVPAQALPEDSEVAQRLADALFNRFAPEYIAVTVNGDRSFVDAKGLLLDGVRVQSIRLDARIDPTMDKLESMVRFSRGELTLLERDINSHFAKNEESGFKDLRFTLTPMGFEAQGTYSARIIFNINIRLKAQGQLALKPDGIYLEQVAFFVEGRRQPELFTQEVLKSLNPILSTSDLPFPVIFKGIRMDQGSVSLYSDLIPLEGAKVTRTR